MREHKKKMQMRKIVSLLLAMVMVLAMGLTVSAATVTNSTGHAYDVYQVLSGTQAEGSAALGDVKWGSGVYGGNLLTALKEDTRFVVVDGGTNIFASANSAADVAAALSANSGNQAVAKAFANVADRNRTTTTAATIEAEAASVNLPAGYYLLVDTGTVAENDAYNPALLQVTNQGDVTIAGKYGVPTVDKSVNGPGDGVDANGADIFDESTDAGIGDEVTFRLKGTISSNLDDYETYKYQFNDTLSKGLTYKESSMAVYLYKDGNITNTADGNKETVTSNFTTTTAPVTTPEVGTAITVSCTNLKSIANVTSSSVIVAEYKATVNSGAAIGSAGNPNKVELEYSNNPNTGGESTGKTPKDTVLVFTYTLNVTKVDGQDSNKQLKDAEFVLMNSAKDKVAKVQDGKLVEWTANADISKNQDETYPNEYTLKSAENGSFSVIGLDAGTYYLKETKAPSGYNKLSAPVKVEISATLDGGEDSPALTALKIKVDDAKEAADGDTSKGTVDMTVGNNSGSTLPETGGMGTTIFYVLGAILVVGAAVLLIVKRRMKAEK